ncbi:uncharacterized protein TNIN_385411 [Trichonephila inaurata madagascariensis]|uniref:Uncharacterized protein n=1 Tax=Trichonephila inaurata madagascariensis TaxID=2747483 RepID=A0A8X6YF52_9ARAC|nr:uncharacterized protein TNIN_385411 [Trichonephila inaurata madagascariensis]
MTSPTGEDSSNVGRIALRLPVFWRIMSHFGFGNVTVGVPHTNSIENIQKKCPPTERLGLLTKKDLHNVSRDFEVNERILHAEDAVSVDLQVKKMQRDSYNPVLIYKPLGSSLANNPLIKKQDFILGIMTEAQLEFLELYGKNTLVCKT